MWLIRKVNFHLCKHKRVYIPVLSVVLSVLATFLLIRFWVLGIKLLAGETVIALLQESGTGLTIALSIVGSILLFLFVCLLVGSSREDSEIVSVLKSIRDKLGDDKNKSKKGRKKGDANQKRGKAK